jgi:hypothetical protein
VFRDAGVCQMQWRVSYPVYSPEFSPSDLWFFAYATEQMKDQVVTDEDDLETSWHVSGRTLIATSSIAVLRVKSQMRMRKNTQWSIFHQTTLIKRESHLSFSGVSGS